MNAQISKATTIKNICAEIISAKTNVYKGDSPKKKFQNE